MNDEQLWSAFTSSTLPESEWNHRAHLRVGWLFCTKRESLDEAHVLMRVGIIRLNVFHGLEETPSRGYHETLTRVWLTLIYELIREVDAPDSATFVDECAHRLSKDVIAHHYSRERIGSLRARTIYVEPDLEPFAPH